MEKEENENKDRDHFADGQEIEKTPKEGKEKDE